MSENGIKSYQEILFISNEKDPYKILGITDDSDIETINRVYRDLAKKYHPDRFAHLSNKDEIKEIAYLFTKITGAFNKLKDPEARKRYDFEKQFRLSKIEAETKPDSAININSQNSININISPMNKNINADFKQRKSDEAEALFNSGLSSYNQNKFEEAINNFQSAIKIEAKVAKYHSYLALAMKKKGWDGYAQAEFKVALHYDPSDKIALENYVPSDSVKPKAEINPVEKKPGFFDKFFKKK